MVDYFNQKMVKKLSFIEDQTKEAFSKVKQEFSEHLEAINENTNEIQSNYEFLVRLENKIDKIEQNLTELNRFVAQFKNQQIYSIDEEDDHFVVQPLTEEEKKIFRVLYELEAEHTKVTYQGIANVLGISVVLCREYILSMIEKGVPIVKNYLNQVVYVTLEPRFRELQTKQNIVHV